MPDEITEGQEFLGEKEEELVDAGFCFVVEKKALDYLNRSEQYRKGLTAKLISKGFSKIHINKVLDYLERKKYLDDRRFAGAWLRNRVLSHAEGRTKLSMELNARGIDKSYIADALDEFFAENDEETLCKCAFEKCKRLKKNQDKTISYLLKNGFSIKLIQKVVEFSD